MTKSPSSAERAVFWQVALVHRLRFLHLEAHIDWLEIIVFGGLINLSTSFTQLAANDALDSRYTLLWHVLPRFGLPKWDGAALVVALLALGELYGVLFGRLNLRVWMQGLGALTFLGVWLSISLSTVYSIVWKDYLLFMCAALYTCFRLNAQYAKSRQRKARSLWLILKTGKTSLSPR